MKKEYKVESMFYDGDLHYHIETKGKNGKWYMIWGCSGLERAHAYDLVEHPDRIKNLNRFWSWFGIAVAIAFVASIIIVSI